MNSSAVALQGISFFHGLGAGDGGVIDDDTGTGSAPPTAFRFVSFADPALAGWAKICRPSGATLTDDCGSTSVGLSEASAASGAGLAGAEESLHASFFFAAKSNAEEPLALMICLAAWLWRLAGRQR